jgi:hypothetical protein
MSIGPMRNVNKISKETQAEYMSWVFNPDESKDYSDFRYVNDIAGKLADFARETMTESFSAFLEFQKHEDTIDFADYIIQELGRNG